MREKNLLTLLLWLNGALAGCFVIYIVVSSSRQPKIATTSFQPMTGSVPALSLTGAAPVLVATASNATEIAANNVDGTNVVAGTNQSIISPSQLTLSNRKIGWEQLDHPEYDKYLESLRAVGCPDEKVRYIVLTDINDLISKRRVKEAETHDIQWWKAEPELTLAGVLQEKGRTLDEERIRLITKYLGAGAVEEERGEALLWSNVQLTGAVLGSLPPDVHNAVQEICGRSLDRSQASMWARFNDGQPLNQVEMAKMREQTRADLRKILKPDAMEEFLLRYSHNAHQLRLNLRGFEPTPDEFRKIFRATDAMDHQLQLEYGGSEALSQEQRERHERERDAAIRESLGPQRYSDYLMTKDPTYRQAQMTALQYGAPAKAILPIYQMTKETEARRQKILNDASLTPQQKSQALNSVQQDQIRGVQKIVSDAATQR